MSFANNQGRSIEFKFVDHARRQYEFSIDSFQIKLDQILDKIAQQNGIGVSQQFFPKVQAVSVFGSYEEAKAHLYDQVIITTKPEQIRGGGLLRYCNLLVRNFSSPGNETEIRQLEQVMCARFFIDFNSILQQQQVIERYLLNHFIGEEQLQFDFLLTLRKVIEQSSNCLMKSERTDIIDTVTMLAFTVFRKYGNYGDPDILKLVTDIESDNLPSTVAAEFPLPENTSKPDKKPLQGSSSGYASEETTSIKSQSSTITLPKNSTNSVSSTQNMSSTIAASTICPEENSEVVKKSSEQVQEDEPFVCKHGCHLVYNPVCWAIRKMTNRPNIKIDARCFVELHSFFNKQEKLASMIAAELKNLSKSEIQDADTISNTLANHIVPITPLVNSLVSTEILRVLTNINRSSEQL